MSEDTPPEYFLGQYSRSADPWELATRWYERRKYACSLAALPQPRYRNAFEPGCSVGVLSGMLAERCDTLLCADHMPVALESAAATLADRPHVRLECRTVPAQWPEGTFDLIVISELAYYLGAAGRRALWERVAGSLRPDGTLLAVHWRPQVPEYASNGDAVHDELADDPAFTSLTAVWDADFRLDVYSKSPDGLRSVAAAEGLR